MAEEPRHAGGTWLACREHAHARYLDLAEQVERFGRMPGAGADLAGRAASAARRYRELAADFDEPA